MSGVNEVNGDTTINTNQVAEANKDYELTTDQEIADAKERIKRNKNFP